MPRSVLITGSSGQVGSYLHEAISGRGEEAIGLDLRPSACTEIVADVRAAGLPKASSVVHCAAQISVQASLSDPLRDADVNVSGTLNLLEQARRWDVDRFVYFSSAAVYGDPIRVPVPETHPTNPLSPYGASKLAGETYVNLYHRLYGVPTVVLRPFNIYSARQDPSNPYSGVIAKFVDRVLQGAAPTIRGTGEQTRDFVHIRDVIQAVFLSLDHPAAPGGTFNVGTGRATSITELARTLIRLSGCPVEPSFEPGLPGEIVHSSADIQHLTGLGYTSRVTLIEGLTELLSAPVRGPLPSIAEW